MAPRLVGWLTFTAFVSTVVVANWLVHTFGVVPIGFGLYGPAAVYVVGLAFVLRDFTQELLGSRVTVLAIVLGACLSAIVSPQIALASGAAFFVSESTDFAVYTPLREKSWPGAVLLSGLAGLVVDSLVFLWLAFGSLEFLPGQVLGKTYMTVLAFLVLLLFRTKREVT